MNKIKKLTILFTLCFSIGIVTFCSGKYKLTAYAYTEEEKAAVKAWLIEHGYPPTMDGAEQAYQDYLNGKIDLGDQVETPPEEPTESGGGDAKETKQQNPEGDTGAETSAGEDSEENMKASDTQQKTEEEKQAEEEEKVRKAEEAKKEEAKKAEEARKAEEAKKAEETRKAEEARKEAEQKAAEKSMDADGEQLPEEQVEESRKNNTFLLWMVPPACAVIACPAIYIRRKKGIVHHDSTEI